MNLAQPNYNATTQKMKHSFLYEQIVAAGSRGFAQRIQNSKIMWQTSSNSVALHDKSSHLWNNSGPFKG